MLGVILSSVIVIFLFIWIVSSALKNATASEHVSVKPNTVLKIDLDFDINERTDYNLFQNFSFGGFEPKIELGLNDILKQITRAKNDQNIKGIFLDFGGFQNGAATAEQIRNTLLDFKKSGKFIVAYAEVFTQKAYYVASVADKIFLAPEGFLEFKGIQVNITFLKNMLEKIGIETQVIYHGKYKTATEPYRLNKMSDANKLMTTQLITNVWNNYLQDISTSRKIPVSELDSIASNLLVKNADDAKQFGLVDDLFYRDQVSDFIADKVAIKHADEINFMTLGKYSRVSTNDKFSLNKIAILYAYGDIVDGKGSRDNIGAERMCDEIRKLRRNENVKAIVFRVNSPGGSALASDLIWREIFITNKVKPVVVSMGDYAASGGYYIACGASKIFAEPNTLTGSIGVFGILPNFQKLFNEKLGITFDGVGTGKHSDFGNLARPLTEEEKKIIENEIEKTYQTFLSRVADGRHKSAGAIDSIGQGHVWTGDEGLKNGLVDAIGGTNEAIAEAVKLCGVTEYRVEDFPEQNNTWTNILQALTEDEKIKMLEMKMGNFSPVFKQILDMKDMNGIQMRMPFVLNMN